MLLSFWVGDVYGEHLGKFKGHMSNIDADLSSLLLNGQNNMEVNNPLQQLDGDDASAADQNELDILCGSYSSRSMPTVLATSTGTSWLRWHGRSGTS